MAFEHREDVHVVTDVDNDDPVELCAHVVVGGWKRADPGDTKGETSGTQATIYCDTCQACWTMEFHWS